MTAPSLPAPPSTSQPSISPARIRPAASTLLVLVGLAFGVACSSSGRRPATGFDAPEDAAAGDMLTDDAREDTATAPVAPTQSPSSSLSPDEINAMPPGERVSSSALDVGTLTVDELNARGLLEDIHFSYDRADLSDAARATLETNAEWLLRYPTVTVLAEGHCDERGTVEYNLALGEERARAMKDYLVRLGVAADRIRTISYGKEFPLDPGHDETAWRRNRRGHLEITGR